MVIDDDIWAVDERVEAGATVAGTGGSGSSGGGAGGDAVIWATGSAEDRAIDRTAVARRVAEAVGAALHVGRDHARSVVVVAASQPRALSGNADPWRC